ncbi:MAG TPA: cytochrome b N-terminal domain-containing protein [Gaiellales bacterium]
MSIAPDKGRIGAAVEAADVRTGRVPLARKLMRYVFPEHWSFLWGEVALYCFVVLVVTGIYLAVFFDPSYQQVVYHGGYAPMRGERMSAAYASALDLSWKVKAGLLMRQTHHWAADLFIASITIHLMRVFFTGAFRKPRELTYWTGLTLLVVAVLEGYMGYSLVDDLLSGMGLAIGWGVAMSIPFIGGPIATWIWDGPFPGTTAFESRLYIAHVLIVPLVIAGLIGLHLLLVSLLHHTQFRGRGRREANVVGAPLWPAQTFRSIGLFLAVAGGLFLLGGLVQINPIWLWGPYHPFLGANGAQPDWYLGWLIGALRMMPNWEPTIAGKTIVPNPFWGGVLFPLIVFGLLYAWPLLERRLSGDRAAHHLLERPRDNPRRTAFGVALFTFTAVPFFAGSMDRVYIQFGVPYEGAVRVMRVLWLVLPVVTGFLAMRMCRRLAAAELRPLRGVTARMVGRDAAGGLVAGPALLANPSWRPRMEPPAGGPPAAAAGLRAAVAQLLVRARRSVLAAAILAAAAVVVLAALAGLVVAVVLAIAAAGAPTWLAALIVAVVLVVACAAVAAAARWSA